VTVTLARVFEKIRNFADFCSVGFVTFSDIGIPPSLVLKSMDQLILTNRSLYPLGGEMTAEGNVGQPAILNKRLPNDE
jgi:hypothetical protein